jgi:hypothetical protein
LGKINFTGRSPRLNFHSKATKATEIRQFETGGKGGYGLNSAERQPREEFHNRSKTEKSHAKPQREDRVGIAAKERKERKKNRGKSYPQMDADSVRGSDHDADQTGFQQ